MQIGTYACSCKGHNLGLPSPNYCTVGYFFRPFTCRSFDAWSRHLPYTVILSVVGMVLAPRRGPTVLPPCPTWFTRQTCMIRTWARNTGPRPGGIMNNIGIDMSKSLCNPLGERFWSRHVCCICFLFFRLEPFHSITSHIVASIPRLSVTSQLYSPSPPPPADFLLRCFHFSALLPTPLIASP